jgi:hypothetical protein
MFAHMTHIYLLEVSRQPVKHELEWAQWIPVGIVGIGAQGQHLDRHDLRHKVENYCCSFRRWRGEHRWCDCYISGVLRKKFDRLKTQCNTKVRPASRVFRRRGLPADRSHHYITEAKKLLKSQSKRHLRRSLCSDVIAAQACLCFDYDCNCNYQLRFLSLSLNITHYT